MRDLLARALVVGIVSLSTAASAEEEQAAVVEDGRSVSIEYTLKLEDGSTVDSNVGGEALVYQQGGDQLLPSLEQELAGMHVGDTKHVELAADQGYGAVDPELFQEVDAQLVPEGARKVGVELVSEAPGGERRLVRVHEVKGDKIVIDHNHPLAGKALQFDIKILAIE